ncbi:MAG: hypothetical protein AB8B83_05070 [Bdellovibrionales bacterium]
MDNLRQLNSGKTDISEKFGLVSFSGGFGISIVEFVKDTQVKAHTIGKIKYSVTGKPELGDLGPIYSPEDDGA